jgi:hypothetical protein
MYYSMSKPGPTGWIMPLVPFHFTLVQNIKRDPFEQTGLVEGRLLCLLFHALRTQLGPRLRSEKGH